MDHLSAEVVDLPSTLERALETAASGLSRTAREVGAREAVVLLAGTKAETAHYWSVSSDGPGSAFPRDCLNMIDGVVGPVASDTPAARILRETILRDSRSFLLVPWPLFRTSDQPRAMTVIFGFAAPVPPHRAVPEAEAANLDLVCLATWSSKEILRLRSELKTVNGRLAGRKTVERAKSILQAQQGLTEEGAYEYMRSLSRSRRITLAQLAAEVLRGRLPQKSSAHLCTVA